MESEKGIATISENSSQEDTYKLGFKLGQQAKPGEVYCLNGDLGVGKTVFAQGFAAGLGIMDTVSSPTFTIVQSYEEGRLPLHHFDVYRIGDVEEMEEIGYEDCFYGEGVCLIEWAERISGILPEMRISILIENLGTNFLLYINYGLNVKCSPKAHVLEQLVHHV